MKTLKQALKQITVRQILTICLAGMLMLTSVACTGSNTQAVAPPTDRPSTTGQGMYPHEDTKRDTSAADAKAERVIKLNEERRQKIENPKDLYEEVDFPVKHLTDEANEVGKSAQRAAKNAADNTEQSLKNIKQNTQNAAERAADAVDQAT